MVTTWWPQIIRFPGFRTQRHPRCSIPTSARRSIPSHLVHPLIAHGTTSIRRWFIDTIILLGSSCSYKGLERCCHIVIRNHLSLETVVTSWKFITITRYLVPYTLCVPQYLVPNTLYVPSTIHIVCTWYQTHCMYLVPGSRCQIHEYEVHTSKGPDTHT